MSSCVNVKSRDFTVRDVIRYYLHNQRGDPKTGKFGPNVVLICKDGIIPAHSSILSGVSPFFRMIFESDSEMNLKTGWIGTRDILLPEFSVRTLRKAIQLIYDDCVVLESEAEARTVLEIVKILQIFPGKEPPFLGRATMLPKDQVQIKCFMPVMGRPSTTNKPDEKHGNGPTLSNRSSVSHLQSNEAASVPVTSDKCLSVPSSASSSQPKSVEPTPAVSMATNTSHISTSSQQSSACSHPAAVHSAPKTTKTESSRDLKAEQSLKKLPGSPGKTTDSVIEEKSAHGANGSTVFEQNYSKDSAPQTVSAAMATQQVSFTQGHTADHARAASKGQAEEITNNVRVPLKSPNPAPPVRTDPEIPTRKKTQPSLISRQPAACKEVKPTELPPLDPTPIHLTEAKIAIKGDPQDTSKAVASSATKGDLRETSKAAASSAIKRDPQDTAKPPVYSGIKKEAMTSVIPATPPTESTKALTTPVPSSSSSDPPATNCPGQAPITPATGDSDPGTDTEPDYTDQERFLHKARSCQKCKRVYTSAGTATSCLSSHNGRVRCYFCFRVCKSKTELFAHYKRVHQRPGDPEGSVVCPYCTQVVPFVAVSCHVVALHILSHQARIAAAATDLAKGPQNPGRTAIKRSCSGNDSNGSADYSLKRLNKDGKEYLVVLKKPKIEVSE